MCVYVYIHTHICKAFVPDTPVFPSNSPQNCKWWKRKYRMLAGLSRHPTSPHPPHPPHPCKERKKNRGISPNRRVFSAMSSLNYKQGNSRLNTQQRGRVVASSDLMSSICDIRLTLPIPFRLQQAASAYKSGICFVDVHCGRLCQQEKNTYLLFPPDNREIKLLWEWRLL